MANQKNYSVLGRIAAWLREIQFTFQGEPLASEDSALMRQVLEYQYALGCDLLSPSRMHQFESWLSSTRDIDVYQFGKFLGEFDSLIKNYLQDFEENLGPLWKDVPSFKRSAVGCKGFWGFIAPIYPELEAFLLQPTYPTLRIIIQGLFRVRSPLLAESLLMSFPRPT